MKNIISIVVVVDYQQLLLSAAVKASDNDPQKKPEIKIGMLNGNAGISRFEDS